MNPVPSEKAIDCFVHGLSHFLWELGPEVGLRRAIGLLEALEREDLSAALHGESPEAFEDEALAAHL